jgi:hypothetical protein
MQEVLRQLQWDEEYYCNLKYRTGFEYLRFQTVGDAEALADLEKEAVYWNWWKNQWLLREEQFLADVVAVNQFQASRQRPPVGLRWLRLEYTSRHCMEALCFTEFSPIGGTADVLDRSYAAMYGRIIDRYVTDAAPEPTRVRKRRGTQTPA